ncbi:MAG: two-component system sensor histidine kinase GlrK [Arenicella sp.]|jgi:two-component system sensor histidine kinase GlrK
MSDHEEQPQTFLRYISHEIKTPLTSIIEGSRLLDKKLLGEMNQEQQEITNTLVRSSAELQRAIVNLLDYNCSLALKKVGWRTRLNLSQLIKHALSNNQLSIRQKQLAINTQLERCFVDVDHGQLLTVFDNLISNAIKHSPAHSTIKIKLDNIHSKEVCVLIEDQGLGIKEEDREFIFDPFYVGMQPRQSALKRTGLGLSIAKRYIDDHSDKLLLLKSLDGAVFKVTLPRN